MSARDTMIFWRLIALAALVVQLVLSAGHVHSHHDAGANVAAAVCSLTDAKQCPPLDHEDEDGDCEICKTLRVSNNFVLPAPPKISRTVEVEGTFCARRSVVVVAPLGAYAFQARGPPVVLNPLFAA